MNLAPCCVHKWLLTCFPFLFRQTQSKIYFPRNTQFAILLPHIAISLYNFWWKRKLRENDFKLFFFWSPKNSIYTFKLFEFELYLNEEIIQAKQKTTTKTRNTNKNKNIVQSIANNRFYSWFLQSNETNFFRVLTLFIIYIYTH